MTILVVKVTQHAIDRYCERIANLPQDEARQRIAASSRAILCAANFGADTVIQGDGARLRLVGASVVTVLANPRKAKR